MAWYDPILTTKTSLKEPFTLTSVKSFLQIYKYEVDILYLGKVFLLLLSTDQNGICSFRPWYEEKLYLININLLSENFFRTISSTLSTLNYFQKVI